MQATRAVLDEGGRLENLGVPMPHSGGGVGADGARRLSAAVDLATPPRLVVAVSGPTVEVASTVDLAPLSTGDGSAGQPMTRRSQRAGARGGGSGGRRTS